MLARRSNENKLGEIQPVSGSQPAAKQMLRQQINSRIATAGQPVDCQMSGSCNEDNDGCSGK
jgi:hypothetical protein